MIITTIFYEYLKRLLSEKGELFGRNAKFEIMFLFYKKKHIYLYFRKFEENQINNTQNIVKKILKEDSILEKKKRLYPNLFNIQKPLKPIVNLNFYVNFFYFLILIFFNFQNKDKDKKDLKSLARLASTLGVSSENVSYKNI